MEPFAVVKVDLWIAFLHGLISFFTPCILPLIPFFVSVVFSKKGFFNLVMFLTGFSMVFVLAGIFSSEIGGFLVSSTSKKITGILIIVMGVLMLSNINIFKLGKITKFSIEHGYSLPSFILGTLIGLSWMPCSTPVLASILILASCKKSIYSALLLFSYSLGMSLPLLIFGKIIDRWYDKSEKLKRIFRVVKSLGAVFIIVIGILIVSGKFVF